jgi:hypothetical protein
LDDLTKSNKVIYISQNQIKNQKLIKKQESNLEEDKKKRKKRKEKRQPYLNHKDRINPL